MYYTVRESPVIPARKHISIEENIRKNILPSIATESWKETADPLPLRYDTNPLTIALSCLPFCDGTMKTNAVYTLECMKNKRYKHTAALQLQRTGQRWNGLVENAERLLYVGVTVNLVRRLDQHINDPGGKAANFTTVFPPIRILNVTWYQSYHEAERAEILTADLLRTAFPDDYISQPG